LFQELILHEFSHSFCNPLIDQNYTALSKDSCLLQPILHEQEEQGYGTWKACLYEHWTRANEIILNRIIYGKETADSLLKKMTEEDKWIYLPGLVDLLDNEYLSNRNKYKTLKPFMPKVIAYFGVERSKCK